MGTGKFSPGRGGMVEKAMISTGHRRGTTRGGEDARHLKARTCKKKEKLSHKASAVFQMSLSYPGGQAQPYSGRTRKESKVEGGYAVFRGSHACAEEREGVL